MLSQHKPKHWSNLNEFDLILTMTEGIKSELRSAKAFTLSEYTGLQGDIEDPYHKGVSAYRRCRDEIKDRVLIAVKNIVRDLL